MFKNRLQLFLALMILLVGINTITTISVFNYETKIDIGDATLRVLHIGNKKIEMIDDQGHLLNAQFTPNKNFKRYYPYDGSYQLTYMDIAIVVSTVDGYSRDYTENGQSKNLSIYTYDDINRQNSGDLGIMVERIMAIYNGPYIKSLLLTNLIMVLILFLTINPISMKDSVLSLRKGKLEVGLEQATGLLLIIILFIIQVGMITYTGRLTSIANTKSLFSQWFILVPLIINLIVYIGNKFFSHSKTIEE